MSSIRALAADLAARSDDQLRLLLEARPDLCLPRVPDFAALASRASTRISVQRALENLSRPELDVLEALELSANDGAETGISGAQLQRVVGGTTIKALNGILDRLHCLALLHRTPPPPNAAPADARRAFYLPVSGLRDALGPYPAGLGRPYRALATTHPDFAPRLVAAVELVRGRSHETEADEAGVTGPAMTAGAAAEQFGNWLGSKANWQALMSGAPDGTAELLARFVSPHPSASPIGSVPGKRSGASTPGEPGPLEWLVEHALLVPLDALHVELPREAGFAARGHRWVERLQPDPLPPTLATVTNLRRDNAAFGAVAETLRLLTELIALIDAAPVGTLRAGGVGVREVRRLAEGLRVDADTVSWLLELAAMAQLISLNVDTSRWAAADAEWPLMDRDAQWVRIAQAWLDSSRAPSLVNGPDSLTVLSAEASRPDAPMVRRRLLWALVDLSGVEDESRDGRSPVVDAAAAVDHLSWHQPRLHRRFARLVPGMLVEAGHLGLAGSGAVTALGRALEAERYDDAADILRRVLPEPLGHFVLQADLTAVAPGYLEPAVARELALLSVREGQGPATIYRFSPESLRAAFDAGQDAATILEFFEQHSATEVPQPLRYLVEDTGARYGRLRVGSIASYLRSDDDDALGSLLTDPRAAALGLRRLAPHVAVSRAGAVELIERLRELGYAPAPDADPAGEAVNSVALNRAATPGRSPGRNAAGSSPGRLNPWMLTPEDVAHQLATLRGAARMPETGGTGTESDSLMDLETLRRAIRLRTAVRMGVVDHLGNQSVETVVPLSVTGGRVRIYDAARDVERVVSIHRVMDVELLTEGQQEEAEQG